MATESDWQQEYLANPGTIRCQQVRDGTVVTWDGGPIAPVSGVYWFGLCQMQVGGSLGFDFYEIHHDIYADVHYVKLDQGGA